MRPTWFEPDNDCPCFDEIEAMKMALGEKLTEKLCQVAHDADESATHADWHVLRTEVKVELVAWSDYLGTGVYVIPVRRGHYLTFSWDRKAVVALSAGRNRVELDERRAIEIALERCEESKGVSSKDAMWITKLA